MFALKVLFCRIYQKAFRLILPLLPYREPVILSSVGELGALAKKENLSSVIIVTDKGIVKNNLIKPLEEALCSEGIGYCIYDSTMPNPTVDNVEKALELYLGNNCSGIIAVGGGSALDCAKALGARVVYPDKTVGQLKGVLKVRKKLPVFVAVPTTAGTGSEVTLAAVITDSRTYYKYSLMSFPLIPHYAVLDATLTYSLPPSLTATTGMDALTHAVEAYIGGSTTKETRRLSLEAVKLIFENVYIAYSDGNNHKARENMLLAAYKAGIAFSKSYVGNIHAVAHTLSGRYNTPHGLANAVIMPYVLEAYGECVYKKLHALGVAAGVCKEDETDKTGAEKFIKAVRELNAKMGIPEKLAGIKEEDIPTMARRAEKEANPLYPVPKIMTAKELEKFYYDVAAGIDSRMYEMDL